MTDPLTTVLAYKYLVFAMVGAAVKTYADFSRAKCGLLLVLSALVANTIVAFTLAWMVADMIGSEFPEKAYLLSPLSFIAGVAGVNLTLAITRIKWLPLLQARLKSLGGG